MPISKELREQIELIKPANGLRKPVFVNKIIYGASGNRSNVVVRRVYADAPEITHEDGHEDDTGWYFPVAREELVMGSRKDYENQITQAKYQSLKNSRK